MTHYATDNERERQLYQQIAELSAWKIMDTSDFKHLLLWFMTTGILLFLQFVSTAQCTCQQIIIM
jgi:hypothetical protein